jgi:hypothetical protein
MFEEGQDQIGRDRRASKASSPIASAIAFITDP